MRQAGIFFFVMLVVSACSFGGVDIRNNADGTLDISVALTEADVNNIVRNAIANSRQLPLRDVRVDLQNGRMVISGTYDRPVGGTANGTVTVNAGVVNGQVQVQITSVDLEGFNANDDRLRQFNESLAQALGARGSSGGQGGQLSGVSISDTTLTLTFRVSR